MTVGFASIELAGTRRVAVYVDGRAITLEAAARRTGERRDVPVSVSQALAEWDRWCDVAEDVAVQEADEEWLETSQIRFLPAITDPPNIFCAGANYYDHAEEMGAPTPDKSTAVPFHFIASRGSLTGHMEKVSRPMGCDKFDWEVELGVVIRHDLRSASVESARNCIAGYTVANDLSARDLSRREDVPFFPDWLQSKCHTGCLPLGPAIIPAAFVDDPMNIDLSLTVNGETKQSSNTSKMIFSIEEQIEYLSGIAGLQAGDIIITGTPAGTGIASNSYLKHDDVVVAEAANVGKLQTRIV